ncbi:MAG: glycosyltransferase [Proteobacteria bacterium]|nr:glycosyltransferase [Pseudomonadota bacterium]
MKISVIITVFNGAKYLACAIESFLAQSYENKELVIVDGISTDGTHEIISAYQKKFPQTIKWIQEKDSGISNARNIALKHVTGDVIGFLGCDDFFHKNFFEEFFYYAALNPNFDVAYFNSYCIGFSNSFLSSATISITRRNLIKHCPIGSGESFYYRKKIFEEHKFNEKNLYSMDYELNMALASTKNYHFFPINIAAVFNQNIGTNQSSTNSIKQRLETVFVQLKYSKNLKEKIHVLWRAKKLLLKNFSSLNSLNSL